MQLPGTQSTQAWLASRSRRSGIAFGGVADRPLCRFLNAFPANFSLSTEQVDRLIATGRELLRNNADFQRLVASLQDGAGPVSPKAVGP